MMYCSKCGKDIIGRKKVGEKGKWEYYAGGAGILLGGPIGMAAGAAGIGLKLYGKYVKDEVEVKCPHCGATLTLTKAEYKDLKRQLDSIKEAERKSKQNRIKKY